jgi:hypothetical protein
MIMEKLLYQELACAKHEKKIQEAVLDGLRRIKSTRKCHDNALDVTVCLIKISACDDIIAQLTSQLIKL